MPAARRAAAIYSLIESAKLNALNPQHYLSDVLARIADHPARRIAELLPWNWQPLDATRLNRPAHRALTARVIWPRSLRGRGRRIDPGPAIPPADRKKIKR